MADAPDSLLISGPDFEQKTPQQFLVTPTGRPQTTLAQALADSSGSVTVVNVQGGPFLLAGTITTTGTVENSVASLTEDGVLFGGGFDAVVAGTRATNAQLIVGQSSGIPVPRSVGGDLTMDNMAQFALVVSGVTAGTYGDATHVGQFEVDDTGRLLSAGNVAISAGTVTQIVVSAAPFLNIGTITSSGTITAATLAGQRLLGNAATVAAVPAGITIGANLALSADGTLSATGGGSVSSVIAGSGLAGGTITSVGTVSLATQAKSTLLGNAGTATAVPGAVAVGSGLTLSVGGTLSATGGGGSVTSVIAQGGPFLTNGTITGAGTITNSIASLLASGLILGGGTAAVASLGTLGTTTTVLHGNAAGAPTFGAVSLSADVAGLLPFANIATLAASSLFGNPAASGATMGAIAIGSNLTLSVGGTLSASAPGTGSVTSVITAAGPFLANTTITSSGTITGAATTLTNHGVLVGQAAAAPVATAVGTDGQVFLGQSAADPAWGTVSGDAAITKAGVLSMTSIVAGATVGSASLIPVITYDAKGRITATTTAANPQGSVTSIIAQGGPFIANGTITASGTISNSTSSLTAHGVIIAEGTGAAVATAAMTNGQLLIGATSADPAPQTMSGDATINSGGTIIVTKSNGSTIGTAAFINTGTTGGSVGLLNTANRWSAAQRGDVSALTSGATVTPDFSLANNFSMTMTISGTLANPTNIVAGQAGQLVITQDGTGGRTLAYGNNFKFVGGTIATLSTAAAAVDVLSYFANTGSTILVSPLKAFS